MCAGHVSENALLTTLVAFVNVLKVNAEEVFRSQYGSNYVPQLVVMSDLSFRRSNLD